MKPEGPNRAGRPKQIEAAQDLTLAQIRECHQTSPEHEFYFSQHALILADPARPERNSPQSEEVLFPEHGGRVRPGVKFRRTVQGGKFIDLTPSILAMRESVSPSHTGLNEVFNLPFIPRHGSSGPGKEPPLNYFALYQNDKPRETFLLLPTSDPAVEREFKRLDGLAALEVKLGPTDKIAQRHRAAEIGLLHQPRFRDIGFQDGRRERQRVSFIDPDLSSIPIKRIIASMKDPVRWVFENPYDGFVIDSGPEGIQISSSNPKVQAAADAAACEQNPARKLRAFIKELKRRYFHINKLSCDRSDEDYLGSSQVYDLLCRHKGVVYLKSSRTARGYLVIRIKCDGKGGLKFASDSPEFEELVDATQHALSQKIGRNRRLLEELVRLDAPLEMIEKTRATLASAREASPQKALLKELLTEGYMPHPIVEENIPTVRVNGEKGEFRLICQRMPTGQLDITAHYTKVSHNGVAANVSLGGRGEKTIDWLRKIYSDKYPAADSLAISRLCEASEAELLDRTRRFAQAYADKLRQDGGPRANDFAIDICPVWDNETQKLEFYFLEMQWIYGFKGLKAVDPAQAERVAAEKVRLELETTMEIENSPEMRLFRAIFGKPSGRRRP